MPLYESKNGFLKVVKTEQFTSEKEIQTTTESNLETIFGLQLIASEFRIKQFRFDTIAFDPETKSFVIIEYKKDEKFSVIDQGYAYLSTMLNNKADLILEYNEKLKGNLKRSDIDWSQSRIYFLSQAFTDYQKEAIKFKGLPIELYEITRYSNLTIVYHKIKSAQVAENIAAISNKNTVIEKVASEVKIATEEDMLNSQNVTDSIRTIYYSLKAEIFKIDKDIEHKITKVMSCFYSGGKGLIWINPSKTFIKLHFRKGNYPNTYKKVKINGWGGYPELVINQAEVSNLNLIEYVKKLIHKAYQH